jgi:protein-S-isoprenylcysteine O-methyltransferase Ste14
MTSILIIGGYFILWALVHSLLASLRVKRWAKATLGTWLNRWYRLLFVIFAVTSLIPLLFLTVTLPDRVLYRVTEPWRWVMLGGQGASLVALVVAVLQASPAYFVGLAQLIADDPEASGDLQVRGFYRCVRHPLYLFSIILIWLTPVMTRNLLTLYLGMTLYFILGSFHEEQLLLHQFGEAYRAYRAQVARFVPRPGRCFKPS